MRVLETAIRVGTPILLMGVESSLDPALDPLLEGGSITHRLRTKIRLGRLEIDCSPTFSLYLSTRNSSCRFSPALCSRVNLINFSSTPGAVEVQVLYLKVMIYYGIQFSLDFYPDFCSVLV